MHRRRFWGALPAVLFALLLPAAASANGTVSKGLCPDNGAQTCLIYTGTGDEFDSFTFAQTATTYTFTPFNPVGYPPAVNITPAITCTALGAGAECMKPADVLYLDTKGGNDYLEHVRDCQCLTVRGDTGPGDDRLRTPNSGNDDVHLGEGNDFIASSSGDDTIDGGPGDDYLEPADGKDDVHGGPGYDTIEFFNYSPGPVTVSLDDVANDGSAGETKNVHSDVEDITGRDTFGDTLIGNQFANVLRGDLGGDAIAGGGADTLEGGGGVDVLIGNAGNDTIKARDGVSDTIDCGPGSDTAITDTIDTVRNCESVQASNELEPDADRDGVTKPSDCNDKDPAVKPGAADPFGDKVDSNCDGVDGLATDRDHDGFSRPQDCNDGDAKIKPGATEIGGNKVDENCDGKLGGSKITTTITFAYDTFRSGAIRLTKFTLQNVPAKATVTMKCKGRGCAFKTKKYKASKKARKRLSALKAFKHRKIYPKVKLEVRIYAPGRTGRSYTFTAKKGRFTRGTAKCLASAKAKAKKC